MGEIVEHRGHTVLPVSWKVIRDDITGTRTIEGIAYNAAIKGERRRVTCSDKTWNDPNDDVFYHDEAVRWTVAQLEKMDLYDVPMKAVHSEKEDLPPVGTIVTNFIDKNGDLHIIGEVPDDTELGKAVISMIDNGACSELSVSYPLDRDTRTGEVFHGAISEVSFVPLGHFRGCKVNIRAGKKTSNRPPTAAPYTIYRTVRAALAAFDEEDKLERAKMANNNSRASGSSTSSTTTRRIMSSESAATPAAAVGAGAAAAAAAAKQFDTDVPASATPEELVRHMAALKKKLMETAKNLADEQEKNQLFESKEKRQRDEYRAQTLPRAEEVLAHLQEIAKSEAQIEKLSDDWREFNKAYMTDPSSLGQEMQAVQVACSRGFRRMQTELKELKERNSKLEQLAQTGAAMLNIDETDFESERSERRDLKAGRRNASAAAAETPVVERAPKPEWVMRFSDSPANQAGQYVPPADRRAVNAGRRTAAAAPVAEPAAPAPPPQQPQQSGFRNYVGRPNNSQSMSQNLQNHELYQFLQDKLHNTDHTSGALAPLAGMNFGAQRV
jgi:hypothetical protein